MIRVCQPPSPRYLVFHKEGSPMLEVTENGTQALPWFTSREDATAWIDAQAATPEDSRQYMVVQLGRIVYEDGTRPCSKCRGRGVLRGVGPAPVRCLRCAGKGHFPKLYEVPKQETEPDETQANQATGNANH